MPIAELVKQRLEKLVTMGEGAQDWASFAKQTVVTRQPKGST